MRDTTHDLFARRFTHAVDHAVIARRGIVLALTELVEEGWLTLPDALDLIDPIMHANARHLFNLSEKTKALQDATWA